MVLKRGTVILLVGSIITAMVTLLYHQHLHFSEAHTMQQHSVTSFSAEEGEFHVEQDKYLVTPSVRTSQFDKFSPLSQQVIDQVEKFVFFIGYTRSGHTIVSSVLDANPNVVIGQEFKVFRMVMLHNHAELINDKSYLFNQLYWKSWNESHFGVTSVNQAGEKYGVGILFNNYSWHGMYKNLRVIGYKSAASATGMYRGNPSQFKQVYKRFSHTLQIPIHVIHVVRNPYDMIATNFMCKLRSRSKGQVPQSSESKDSANMLLGSMSKVFWLADGVLDMIMDPELDLKVLEVHNADFVKKPAETVKRICAFLEVDCPEGYVQACKEKAYIHVSKTREAMHFPKQMITQIGQKLNNYPFFRRYTYNSID